MTCSSSEYGTHRCVRCDSEVEDATAVKAELEVLKFDKAELVKERDEFHRDRDRARDEVEVWKREHAKAHGDWIETRKIARANMDAHSEALLEIEKLKRELADEKHFRFELSEKAPHLMGCAYTFKGEWICDERCLVEKHKLALAMVDSLRKDRDALNKALMDLKEEVQNLYWSSNNK